MWRRASGRLARAFSLKPVGELVVLYHVAVDAAEQQDQEQQKRQMSRRRLGVRSGTRMWKKASVVDAAPSLVWATLQPDAPAATTTNPFGDAPSTNPFEKLPQAIPSIMRSSQTCCTRCCCRTRAGD